MTLVRIEIGQSAIHGIGCFAKEPIKKGQMVWRFDEQFDRVLKKEFVNSLPAGAKENLLTYAYVSKTTGDYILSSDDTKFTNHSNTPNISCFVPDGCTGNELVCFANQDIAIGEEMTNDYRDFDVDPYDVESVINGPVSLP
ncbi:MAG: SET domain-containing protein [Verrucomicrobiae bacterium]|nr:SET domain-containing protein [Verrucomicrobiae bacterium]